MSNKTILNLSAIDCGGAGKFTVNFHTMLLESGYDSYVVVKQSTLLDTRILEYPKEKFEKPIQKFTRKMAKWQWSKTDFEFDRYFYGVHERQSTVTARKILLMLPEQPKMIFIHWIANFVNAKIIHELHSLTSAKVIWLMLDNAPITGGCHFPWDCANFETDCHQCPAILDPAKKWLAMANLKFKKNYQIPSASIWVFSQNDFDRAKQSALFSEKYIGKMPGYFVDERVFRPGDRTAAKQTFGIPKDNKVILFGSVSLDERRKGLAIFLSAIEKVDLTDTTLLIAGKADFEINLDNVMLVGMLNESQLINAYQAADLFVCPTMEDSGPTMINQALMCGTPIVSFSAGLGRDLVHTGKTGYRAEMGSPEDLAQGMSYVLNLSESEASEMSTNCRTLALALYGGVDWYKEAIARLIAESK